MSEPAQDDEPHSAIHFDEGDERVDLSDVSLVDAPVFLVFWGLAIVVFLQFFTRYVLNDSLAWTEEIARYLLMWTGFIGLVMVVRKESNIAVEIFYRWMPAWLRRGLSVGVDLLSIAFYGYMTWLCVQLSQRTRQSMTAIDWPKSWIYWGITAALAVCTLYAILVAIRHWRTGSSPLIRMGEPLQAPQRPGME